MINTSEALIEKALIKNQTELDLSHSYDSIIQGGHSVQNYVSRSVKANGHILSQLTQMWNSIDEGCRYLVEGHSPSLQILYLFQNKIKSISSLYIKTLQGKYIFSFPQYAKIRLRSQSSIHQNKFSEDRMHVFWIKLTKRNQSPLKNDNDQTLVCLPCLEVDFDTKKSQYSPKGKMLGKKFIDSNSLETRNQKPIKMSIESKHQLQNKSKKV